MKLKVKVDADSGSAYLAVIDPSTGEHRKSATLNPGQEIELTLPEVHDAAGVEIGDVVDSNAPESEAPASEEGEAPATPEGVPPGTPPAGDGDGESPETEAPTTSAASEKPLYLIDAPHADAEGNQTPEGFEPSGLETPDGKTLYHYAGDTAGEASTGNVDGVSVYAEADDNEQPVQAEAPAESEQPAA